MVFELPTIQAANINICTYG